MASARECGNTDKVDVILVGRRVEDNENLGLGYLAAALDGRAAVESWVLNRAEELADLAEAILTRHPLLVGLSIPDGGSAYLPLALGELLQRRGYSGHITAGGPFATLARNWLLERYCWLGSVVRFAGEAPLRGMVMALQAHRVLEEVPGVTTRAGDGVPAPVASELPFQLHPRRGPRPHVLGHGVAHVQATRGCVGRCSYCGPTALQSQETEEGRRAGLTPKALRELGVGGVRRRDTQSICEEIAALYREGVRYFYFVDEHVLPPEEKAALAFLTSLRAGLQRCSVGPVGFGCMLRAELLTEPLVDAFVAAGLVRAFIGVELATPAEGRRYRRRVDPDHGARILARLEAAGVATVTNLMLLHPYATAASVEGAVERLSQFNSGVIEATRMQVYHGSRLAQELAAQGRLTGNPLRYGYHLEDPVADRFTELFMRLRLRAFGDHSVGASAHSLSLAVALGARLDRTHALGEARVASQAIERATRELYVDCYREALALARDPRTSPVQAQALVARAAATSRALGRRIDIETAGLTQLLACPPGLFAPMRAAASTSLAFALVASAACGGAYSRESESNNGSAAGVGAAGAGGVKGTAGTAGPGGSTGVARTQSILSGGSMSAGAANLSIDPYIFAPTTPACQAAFAAAAQRVNEQVPCFDGTLRADGGTLGEISFSMGILTECGDRVLGPRHEDAARAALATLPAPGVDCKGYQGIRTVSPDLSTLQAKASECGWQEYRDDFVVIFDTAGQVVDVTAREKYGQLSKDALACIKAALQGLTFPCLAGGTICAEPICIE